MLTLLIRIGSRGYFFFLLFQCFINRTLLAANYMHLV